MRHLYNISFTVSALCVFSFAAAIRSERLCWTFSTDEFLTHMAGFMRFNFDRSCAVLIKLYVRIRLSTPCTTVSLLPQNIGGRQPCFFQRLGCVFDAVLLAITQGCSGLCAIFFRWDFILEEANDYVLVSRKHQHFALKSDELVCSFVWGIVRFPSSLRHANRHELRAHETDTATKSSPLLPVLAFH